MAVSRLIMFIFFLASVWMRIVRAQAQPPQTLGTSSVDLATNNGPLTTTFTPPSTCFYTTAIVISSTLVYEAAIALTDSRIPGNPAARCIPGQKFQSLYRRYWSPGICPSGYYGASKQVNADETRATCCPTGFTPASGVEFCLKSLTSSIVTAQAVITFDNVLHVSSPSTAQTFTGRLPYLYADIISIRWRDSDFETTASTTAVTTMATEGGASDEGTTSISPTQLTTTGASSSGTSGKISRRAKIGVAVGVPLAVLSALAILGCYCFTLRRRRARERALESNYAELDPTQTAKQELDSLPINITELPAMPEPPPPALFELSAQRPTETSTAASTSQSRNPETTVASEATPMSPNNTAPQITSPVSSEIETEAASAPTAISPIETEAVVAEAVSPALPTDSNSPSTENAERSSTIAPIHPEDLAGLNAEKARIQHRRQILQDLQRLNAEERRLKEEERELAENEAAIEARIRSMQA